MVTVGKEYGLIYIIRHLLCNAIAVKGDTNADSVTESAVPANGAQLQITDFHLHNFLFLSSFQNADAKALWYVSPLRDILVSIKYSLAGNKAHCFTGVMLPNWALNIIVHSQNSNRLLESGCVTDFKKSTRGVLFAYVFNMSSFTSNI